MPHPRSLISIPFLALLWCTSAPAAAQLAPTPRAAGFAGAYVALARGSEAADWNPANLALPGQPQWSVSFPNLGLTAAVGGPPLGELRTLLRDGLSDAERQAFLDLLPQTGLDFRGDIQVPWIGASVGRFAFGISSMALVDVRATWGMVDMYLEARQNGGLDPQRVDDYQVGSTGFRGAALTSAVVAYGHALPFLPIPASIGVGARAVVGHGLQHGRIYDPVLDPDAEEVRIAMLSMGGPTGYGFGFDVGVAARPLPGLTMGLAVENLIQSMTWRGRLELRGGHFTDTELAGMGPADFADRFEPRTYIPEIDPPEAAALAATMLDGAMRPRIVRLGAAYEIGGAALGVTLSQAGGSGRLHAGWPRYLAVGAEQNLFGFWRMRGGIASSLSGASAVALGSTFTMGTAQLTFSTIRARGDMASVPAGIGDRFDFPTRLTHTSGYAFVLGLDIRKAPPPPRPSRRPR